eukprot:scaffold8733_cov114-Isochrysis_galbana.AAC.5
MLGCSSKAAATSTTPKSEGREAGRELVRAYHTYTRAALSEVAAAAPASCGRVRRACGGTGGRWPCRAA